ncbi:MAG: ribosomal-processing cysteine protease Prp [Lachnospiraceae bacterium]|nr:ribosomal-processing cysteine protease Prp [Lachnospiraceae bacterium]
MIDVSIKKRHRDFTSLTTKGHALFDETGKDIVCAAVSVLIINTINSIEKYADCNLSVVSDQDEGYIDCNIENPCAESNLLMKSLILGLSEIRKTYSEEYVKITIKEV